MSRSALAYALPLDTAAVPPVSPAPWVNEPVAAGWQAWTTRLDAVLDASFRDLQKRGRRARRVTLTLTFADGRKRRRTFALSRPSDRSVDFRPAALGVLRLLVDRHPASSSRLAITLGGLVEGPGEPIRFERFLAARKREQSLVRRTLAKIFRDASRR